MNIEDKGCNMGKSLSCLNDGKCLVPGLCECEIEYTGSTCSEFSHCELINDTYKMNPILSFYKMNVNLNF